MAALAVAEGAPQRADLNLQIRFLDERLRPGSSDQLLLADHLARAFDQRGENVKGAAAETHRFIPLEQEPLPCKKPERAKRDCISVHGAGLSRDLRRPAHTEAVSPRSDRRRRNPP
jgi:hypothetical protein